jgi:hypothetical protein
MNFRAIDAFIRWNLNRGDTTEMFLFESDSLIKPMATDNARIISRFEEEASTQKHVDYPAQNTCNEIGSKHMQIAKPRLLCR